MLLIGDRSVPNPGRIRGLLAAPPAVWLGLRSYSLYLWHWPIDVIFRWTIGLEPWPSGVVASILALLAASGSYRWIERPIRSSPRLLSLPLIVRIAGFMMLSLVGWQTCRLLIEAQPRVGLGSPTRQAADWYGVGGLLKQVRGSARLCDPQTRSTSLAGVAEAVTEYLPLGCPQRSAARLFVIGDSHAVAYLPLLEQYSAEEGRAVNVVHPAGCPYIDLMHRFTERAAAHCYRLAREAMDMVLASARPGDVVFLPSLRLPRLISLGGSRRLPAVDAHDRSVYRWTAEEIHAVEQARIDAPRWFVPFMHAGLRVIFEAPLPIFRAHPFSCVDVFNRGNPDCSGGLVERRADQEAYRAPIVASLTGLAKRHPGVRVWDPLPLLCDASTCRAMRSDRPLFFDADHISPYGNLVLYGAFARAMEDAFGASNDVAQP